MTKIWNDDVPLSMWSFLYDQYIALSSVDFQEDGASESDYEFRNSYIDCVTTKIGIELWCHGILLTTIHEDHDYYGEIANLIQEETK